jgi:HD superfamily phosphohydrolase YqeK
MITHNLDTAVGNIEKKWLDILYKNCASQFSKVHLPSHDAEHHRRVWDYAKELISSLNSSKTKVTEADIEQLIIAAFFHDQGMSESFSAEHGKISSRLCSSFFMENHLPVPVNFSLVLDSIELHDKKDYKSTGYTHNAFDLQQLLNIADDLDAFSIIGAYRYIEIYMLRDIQIRDLPQAIMNNVKQRYIHLTSTFGDNPEFLKKQEMRYNKAYLFFEDFAAQLNNKKQREDALNGPMGVAGLIKNIIIEQKKSIPEACLFIEKNFNDSYMLDFFRTLNTEYATSADVKI